MKFLENKNFHNPSKSIYLKINFFFWEKNVYLDIMNDKLEISVLIQTYSIASKYLSTLP